jgi:hypothetical protein
VLSANYRNLLKTTDLPREEIDRRIQDALQHPPDLPEGRVTNKSLRRSSIPLQSKHVGMPVFLKCTEFFSHKFLENLPWV